MTSSGADEVLLGFDAREMWLSGMRKQEPGSDWPTQFLLRTELDDILSADTMVWPSIFKSTVALDPGPELPLPEWFGMNVPFWDNLGALIEAVPEEFGQDHPFWLIAATWHTGVGCEKEETREGKLLGPYIAATTPSTRANAWRFLGFDITDSGISGLSNCGYEETERGRLADEWGRHLNRFHLFEDPERAFEFRTLTNSEYQSTLPSSL